ncbi:HAD hydrolase-like protein [Lysinibacillus fusiformis]
MPFPNLLEMLEELMNTNLILGIITNAIGQFQMDSIKALGIENYFQPILVSEWEGVKKPDPNILTKQVNDRSRYILK